MARFVCRKCPGKACPLEISDGPEIVVPEGKCTVLHPPHGVRSAIEKVEQVWEEVA
jgi:hypothetical protein